MDALHALEVVLAASVKKRGDIPLTSGHLLNIVRMARKVQARQEEIEAERDAELLNEVMTDHYMYGSD